MGVYRGSKEDLIEFLIERAEISRSVADDDISMREKRYWQGFADGLDQARRVVVEWEILSQVKMW
jgi:hypothetical protein